MAAIKMGLDRSKSDRAADRGAQPAEAAGENVHSLAPGPLNPEIASRVHDNLHGAALPDGDNRIATVTARNQVSDQDIAFGPVLDGDKLPARIDSNGV